MTKRDKISLTITGVLAVVLILLVLGNSRKAKQKIQQRRQKIINSNLLEKKKTAGAPIFAGAENTNSMSYQAFQEQAKKLKLKRDPFTQAQLSVSPKSSSTIKLSGIVWDDKNPAVVINNEIFYVGDTVRGKVIIKIEPQKVTLSDGSQNIELKLRP